MNNTIKMISLLLIFSFMNGGCSKEIDSKTVTIALSPIYSTYPDDINETEAFKETRKYVFTTTRRYLAGDKEGEVVDTNVYNFLVSIYISVNENMKNKFSLNESASIGFNYWRCDGSSRVWGGTFRDFPQKVNNGTFYYQDYISSPILAQRGFLNNIGDVCLKIDESLNTQTTEYNYTSNTVVIPAQEIKNMLDGLGIPYE